MKHKIFVDGQFGTTGLKIHEMLSGRDELEILTISEQDKKNPEVKKALLNEADVVFLCLPDEASKESVSYITNENTKVIDASTAHRTNSDWTYGIPELNDSQREEIQNSKRLCIPGCHATGFIMAIKPLVDNGIVSPKRSIVCHSITGFSGGGRQMIEAYEDESNLEAIRSQRPYGLNLAHKHLPEMKYIIGLDKAPLFTPSVGNFKQGMLVMSYLIKEDFLKIANREDVIELYKDHYKGESFVKVATDNVSYLDHGFLDAEACNNTNRIEISVYDSDDYMVIISRLDNLGKGASGAAVQNMNLMLGLDESAGLKA